MSRRRPEPSCSRCGNEADLWIYRDGRTYCAACLACPHGSGGTDFVCLTCLRRLHTVVTADGPRIRDVEVYAICARDEYGAYPHTLRVWTFDEEEQLHQLAVMVSTGPPLEVTAAPPHHRLGRLERPGRPGR